MKKVIAATAFLLAAGAATAYAGVNFNVNLDLPAPMAAPPVVVASPPPPAVIYQEPEYAPAPVQYAPAPVEYAPPPRFVVAQPPMFVYAPELGYYVSVGTQLPILYQDGGYYVYNGGYWWIGPSYGGPWSIIPQRTVPYGLRRYRYDQIVHFRDREYRVYMHDRDHYRGRIYRPEHREHRERWREERREHEQREHEHRDHDRWDHDRR
jgi:hypothetical protein